jgi:hypothetical protein
MRGSIGEGDIRDYISLRTGIQFRQIGLAVSKKYPWMRASPDGIYRQTNGNLGIIEIKIISSSKRRSNIIEKVIIPTYNMKPLLTEPIIADHYHQTHYTAGVLGATEIIYVALLCSNGSNFDSDDTIIMQKYRFNKELFENVHVPKAWEIFKNIERRKTLDRFIYGRLSSSLEK